MSQVLIPLPDNGFDVTEVAVPWKLLTRAGHGVTFATENGGITPSADPYLLADGWLRMIGAAPEARAFYAQLQQASSFQQTCAWKDIDFQAFDALILPGGHAPQTRQLLGSEVLHAKTRAYFALGRPVGAICHGVIVAARADVLKGRKTTCLPKYMERTGYFLTAWKLGRHYRTYPEYVEDEVRRALAQPGDFVRGPLHLMSRGTDTNDAAAFVVEDGNYVSARWPGDAYLFAKAILKRLQP